MIPDLTAQDTPRGFVVLRRYTSPEDRARSELANLKALDRDTGLVQFPRLPSVRWNAHRAG